MVTGVAVDAHVPEQIVDALAACLLNHGTVLFADNSKNSTNEEVGLLRLGLIGKQSSLVKAADQDQVQNAFDARSHDWSMGAQWLMSVDLDLASKSDIVDFATSLYKNWQVPSQWPDFLKVLIEAGVDGDAAGVFCKTASTLEDITTDLITFLDEHKTTV